MPKRAIFCRAYGPWAVVTGAARGTGAEFARQIASLGINVVMVDQLGSELNEISAEIATNCGVETRALVCDLRAPDFLSTIQSITDELEVGLLVCNAAHSAVGTFLSQSMQDKLATIDVNIRSTMLLTDFFARAMVARGRGGIVLVASAAGLYGAPLVSHYAASKAYNLVLASGLWDELRSSGVHVLAIVPGTTDTPGLRNSNPNLAGMDVMPAHDVIADALENLPNGPYRVAGRLNRVAMGIFAFLPRALSVRVMARFVRRMYPHAT